MPLSTPVAYIVFNRPDHTATSFARIRAQRPERLFLIADGPRTGHLNDQGLCEEVRAMVTSVDWPCSVHTNFAEENLGLKRRVSSGLQWVFDQVDRAIVIEDDCVPSDEFFSFVGALLDRYEADDRVVAVTGDNFQAGLERGFGSYYFSKYCHVWGWATWRRAWRLYDGNISFWPEWRESDAWRSLHPDPVEREYWEAILDKVAHQEIDSWAYPWQASVWHTGGLTATPNANLVSNIGFGPDATHTKSSKPRPGVPTARLGDLQHPTEVRAHDGADHYTFDHHYGGRAMRRQRRPVGYVLWAAERIARRIVKAVRR